MYTLGKNKRWQNFFYHHKQAIIVPIDHGLTLGPIEGIESVSKILKWVNNPNIDGIIAHKGMIERLLQNGLKSKAIIMHLNGMSATATEPNRKILLSTVDHAIQLGADAVSVQVNFNGSLDEFNIALLGEVVEKSRIYGLPVLAMIYNKTPKSHDYIGVMRHYIRIACELGVDAVKIEIVEPESSLNQLLEGLVEDIKVFVAGGALSQETQFLNTIHLAAKKGIAGLSVGRNIFQREDKEKLLLKLREILE